MFMKGKERHRKEGGVKKEEGRGKGRQEERKVSEGLSKITSGIKDRTPGSRCSPPLHHSGTFCQRF